MEFKNLLIETVDSVATLTVNRPRSLNALNGEVLDDIADFYRKLWSTGPAGTAVTLRMERDNDAFEVTVRTGDRGKYHKYGSD